MASKTLSITESVYASLSREKVRDESFSEVISRLIRSKGRISECAGLWSDMPREKIGEINRTIKEMRGRSTDKLLR